MEKINWTNTKTAIEILMYLWWMFSIVALFIGLVDVVIYLATGTLRIPVPAVLGTVVVAGIIVPGLWFRYQTKQED